MFYAREITPDANRRADEVAVLCSACSLTLALRVNRHEDAKTVLVDVASVRNHLLLWLLCSSAEEKWLDDTPCLLECGVRHRDVVLMGFQSYVVRSERSPSNFSSFNFVFLQGC